jgi:hypothetical protein
MEKRLLIVSTLIAGAAVVAAGNASGQSGAAPPVTVVEHADSVLGKSLICDSGEAVGRIVDVLADDQGRMEAAVVSIGGFLGVGGKKIAVAWDDLRFETGIGDNAVSVPMSLERLSRAPEVKPGKRIVIVRAERPRRRVEAF